MGRKIENTLEELSSIFINLLAFGFIAAGVSVLVGLLRLAIYLVTGSAPHTVCDTVVYLTRADPSMCVDPENWLVGEHVVGWILAGTDATLGMAVLALILIGAGAAVGIFSILLGLINR